ncbi:MAG TPA: YeeE/YedE thiosulfate transporter family protein [Candidatus Ozemobacteraceae bacterium]|nr:YeeE/YedE thiosulfate transporter family protein [Candidatus Ozemobacteraceae bacterium]
MDAPESKSAGNTSPQPYLNPYLAGLLLGLTLLASFLILGAGLGASAGMARLAAFCQMCIAPEHVLSSEYFGGWGKSPLNYYLVFMLAGTFLGGFLSAWLSGRQQVRLERGTACAGATRAVLAIVGGVIAGFASRLAQGCTSGQALTGSALLLTGSLVYLCCVFAGGYAAAWFFRSQWHD